MTELALSSIGANPHHGTPLSIWDRATQRIPGGSSAGAALSVADRMAYAAIGSDTGGSCRIPAAFNHLVGFRPSQRRISTRGVMPFSHSMDTVGPLSRTVDCCAALDSVLSDEPPYELRRDLLGVSIGVPDGLVLEGLDVHVGQAFEDALSVMRRAGADLQEIDAPEFKEIFDTNAYADLGVYEVFQIYREVAEQCSAKMDPRIRNRILTGSGKTAAQYARLLQQRNRLMQACSIRFANLDAIMFPTVPIVPPPISGIADDNDYLYYNKLLLRNTSLISFIDGCSITVPISREPDPPVGLMFSGVNGSDRKVMSVAAGFESVFSALLH